MVGFVRAVTRKKTRKATEARGSYTITPSPAKQFSTVPTRGALLIFWTGITLKD
jgi:hypothetical protein